MHNPTVEVCIVRDIVIRTFRVHYVPGKVHEAYLYLTNIQTEALNVFLQFNHMPQFPF